MTEPLMSSVGTKFLMLLCALEKASLELADAAHDAAALKDPNITAVNVAHGRWIEAEKKWRQAVEACRKARR